MSPDVPFPDEVGRHGGNELAAEGNDGAEIFSNKGSVREIAAIEKPEENNSGIGEAATGSGQKESKDFIESSQQGVSEQVLRNIYSEQTLRNEHSERTLRNEQSKRTLRHESSNPDLEKQGHNGFPLKAPIQASLEKEPEELEEVSEPPDPNIVDWDGPDDPMNPMNWPAGRRWGMIAVVSAITFLTPLGSSMFAPGVPLVMKDFHSTNEDLAGFVVSVYVLGFAFGPLVIAPLSEMWGRNPLYHSCNCLFIIFNVACALSSNLNMLIGFRFLSGCAGSAPITLGGGTIADVISREQRGTAMSVWIMGPTVGPVVGPIAGGFLSQAVGWRWTFWVLAITSGVMTLLGFLLLRETSAVALLSRKTAQLRASTGNPHLRSALDASADLSPRDLFLRSIVRPTKMLIRSPIVFLISLYVAVVYAYLYLLFTTFTPVYQERYGFTLGTAGLAYLGIGVGACLAQVVNTRFGNESFRKHVQRGDWKPEHRLKLMVPGAMLLPVGLFWYGWSAQARTQWVVPIIGTGFFGFGLMLSFMPAVTYLVDVFTIYAASAMAANTVLRSVAAAVLPLAGQRMYATLGLGWGNSLLAFIALVLMPTPLIFMRYGEMIRTKYPVKL